MSPRRPRSPGQRSFGGDPAGSPAEWHKVANSPPVKRMLKDPQLASALYQNFRQTGGQLPQPGMATGGVARFDKGGSVTDEDVKQAYDEWTAAQRSGDAAAAETARKKYMAISQKRTEAVESAAQAPAAASVGNQQVSSSTMAGLKKLGQSGPPTAGNIIGSTLMGAAMGGMGTGSGSGALIGAGTAGLLNYFIRRSAQQKKKAMDEQPGGSGGGGGYQPEPSGQPSPQTSSAGATASPGVPAPQTGAGGAPLSPDSQLAYGTANVTGGNVVSRDGGKTWTNPNARPGEDATVDPTKVAIANQQDVILPSQPQAPSGLMNLPVNTNPANLPTMGTGLGALDETDLMAKGGPVPEKPHSMPIPVLHIAIIAKPKGKPPLKRSMGGDIPQSERRPRRPHAIPPIAGPESSGARLPHGRVQVPKGSGAAIRGKRFGGVF